MREKLKIKKCVVKDFESDITLFCKQIIDDYYNDSYINNKHSRELSWDKCHGTFKRFINLNNISSNDYDYLELVLANYLASYGMYRNSPLLTKFGYTIHHDAIKIILKNEYKELLDFKPSKVNFAIYKKLMFGGIVKDKKIEGIYNELYEFYKNTVGLKDPILLVTKVLLGTLCCIPALDNYFIKGKTVLLPQNISFSSKNKILCETLHNFCINNNQFFLKSKFPPMKCIDIIFNLIGYKYSI